MPKISICMAAYNHQQFVGEAIQSVLDQTFQDWELIITDDASPDHTADVISHYNDPRIKFFKHEKNQGIAITTADCIKKAQGTYIAILNSDDRYRPAKLEKQVQILDERPEVWAVFTHVWFINRYGGKYNKLNIGFYTNKRNIFNKSNRSRREWLNYFFYYNNTLCDPSVMARREVYTEIAPPDPHFPIAGDFNRWVRLCLHHDIFIIPEILLDFRIHQNASGSSWLTTPPKIDWEYFLILRNYLEIKTPDELQRIFPELYEGQELDPDLIPYYLALPASKMASRTYRLFAVSVLSDLLDNPDKAAKLDKLCGFTHKDLHKLYKTI